MIWLFPWIWETRKHVICIDTSVIKIGHKQSWWQIHTLKTESSDKVLPNKFVNWMTLLALACIYMDLRNVSCLTWTSSHHWERDGSRQKPEPLDNWIRCLSSANQNAHPKHWIVFSAYRKWVVFCIVHCMMQSAMMAYINVQCILDCLPVSVSTEPVYSDDQFAHSYSNPYKLNINGYNLLKSESESVPGPNLVDAFLEHV